MPENRKELRSCHDCGLESLGDCEERKIHRPVDEKSPPCARCSRNRYISENARNKCLTDFFSEVWTLSHGADGHWSPLIEDANPLEQDLLRRLHALVNVQVAR